MSALGMPPIPPATHSSPASAVPEVLPLTNLGVTENAARRDSVSSYREESTCWARFCTWVSSLVRCFLSLFGCGNESVRTDTPDEEGGEGINGADLHRAGGSAGARTLSSNEVFADPTLKDFYDNMMEADLLLVAPDRGRALEWSSDGNTYWVWCDPATRVIYIEKKEAADRFELLQLHPRSEDSVVLSRPEGSSSLSSEESEALNGLLAHVQWIKEEKERLRELANRFNPTCLSLLFSFFSGPLGANLRYNAGQLQKQAMQVGIPRVEGEGIEFFRVWVKIEEGKYYFNFQEDTQYHYGNQEKKLGICLNASGEILSVYIEGQPASEEVFNNALYTPGSEWNKRLTAIINQFLFERGFYIRGLPGGTADTTAVHRLALEQVPELILLQLIEQGELRNIGSNRRIKFLNDAFAEEVGIDAGGPTKEFFTLLARSLLDGNPSRTIAITGGIPIFNDGRTIFSLQRLGALFSVCQSSNLLITGRLLPDRYFELLCYLARIGINQPLSEEQIVEASIALVTGDLDIPDWIGPCVRGAQALGDEQKEYVDTILCLDVTGDDYRQALREWLLESYQKQVGAAWYILNGMTPQTRQAFCSQAPEALSNQVQGLAFNREVIAGRIEMSYVAQQSSKIRQKVKWLKEHILDETTPQEWVEQFLFTVTGQKALAGANKITIQPSNDEACHAHTCFGSIEVPQSHTSLGSDPSTNPTKKQKFLNNLQITMNNEGYDAG